jgi:hypothetical protein
VQTLASVRLSQQRDEDAKQALHRGWELWRNLENGAHVSPPLLGPLEPRKLTWHRSFVPDSPLYPPAPSRLTCAKLFLELSEHVPALQILNRLEDEDDEDSEVWYLSGWAWWLLGESRGEQPKEDDVEGRGECWSESRLCLENYLRVRRLPTIPACNRPKADNGAHERSSKSETRPVPIRSRWVTFGSSWANWTLPA